jgi:phage N-6-adenine-methyltransferase
MAHAGGSVVVDKVHYSSKSTEGVTPQWLYNLLDSEFHFELDPAASDVNAKCDLYYTKEENGLAASWAPYNVFVNPPYGRQVGKWVKKAHDESLKGAVVVMLLASRTSNLWWFDYVMKAAEIRFINGRLMFENAQNVAPFPSAIVIFDNHVRMVDELDVPIIGKSINAREHRKRAK